MHMNVVRGVLALGVALCGGATLILAQGQVNAAAQVHIEAARKAAGTEHKGVFDVTCGYLTPPSRPAAAQPAATRTPGPPARDTWFTEPAKVFDNLYFLGQTEYSVVGGDHVAAASSSSTRSSTIRSRTKWSAGMKKLGLDPAQIKYVIVSHGHGDHSGGAKYLQDKFGARVILSAADWDLLERTKSSPNAQPSQARHGRDRRHEADPRRHHDDALHHSRTHAGHDLDADSGEGPRPAAPGGGMGRHGIQLGGGPANYITPDRPAKFWFDTYSKSAERFRDIASKAGADIIIANHTNFDGTKTKLPALAQRQARRSRIRT